MRTLLAPGGIPTFVSKKEHKVYEDLVERRCKDDLSERDVYLLQGLINKNLVKKIVEDKKVYFERARNI